MIKLLKEERNQWILIALLSVCLLLLGIAVYALGSELKIVRDSVLRIEIFIMRNEDKGKASGFVLPPEQKDESREGSTNVKTLQVESLPNGSIIFRHDCEGIIKKAVSELGSPNPEFCIGRNQLSVVKNGEEKQLLTVDVQKPEEAVFLKDALTVPGEGGTRYVLLAFGPDMCRSVGDCGPCMPYSYQYRYDIQDGGALTEIRNFPGFGGGVWNQSGQMAYLPACGSGAGHPMEQLQLYDIFLDKSTVVDREWVAELLPGEGGYGYAPTNVAGDLIPYIADLSWDAQTGFSYYLYKPDGTVEDIFFNEKGKITSRNKVNY